MWKSLSLTVVWIWPISELLTFLLVLLLEVLGSCLVDGCYSWFVIPEIHVGWFWIKEFQKYIFDQIWDYRISFPLNEALTIATKRNHDQIWDLRIDNLFFSVMHCQFWFLFHMDNLACFTTCLSCCIGSSKYNIWCRPWPHPSKHSFVPARLGDGRNQETVCVFLLFIVLLFLFPLSFHFNNWFMHPYTYWFLLSCHV